MCFSMITPKYLKQGDKIGIIATARKISKIEIEAAVEVLKSWGLEIVFGKNMFNSFYQFSGTDEERADDLQQMIDDESIKAVFCARGGYGTVRIIDKIDFSKFCKNPKWIIGYSDITVLHSHINSNFSIETIHACMPINFTEELSEQTIPSLKKAIFGKLLEYEIVNQEFNMAGNAKGKLVGGNLSILYSLIGGKSDISTDGKILFIEDLDEYLYHIDRMMMNLKRTGKLDKLAGLIVGGMSKMNDNLIPFGKSANEIIAEIISEYDYPVCFDFPAGHISDNRALILGRMVELNVSNTVTLKF